MSDVFISREQAGQDLLAAAAFIGERIKSSDGHAAAMNAVLKKERSTCPRSWQIR
jgi:hypothetical protein